MVPQSDILSKVRFDAADRWARQAIHGALKRVNLRSNTGLQRLYDEETTRMCEEVMRGWDQELFVATFKDYWNPFPGVDAKKYLNVDYWMRRAVIHYMEDGLLFDSGAKSVLDIGCGMGFFLAVCRHNGHKVTGLDLDNEPIYNLSVDYLDIDRIVHRIGVDDFLPAFGRTFDVVTAYMACFNWITDSRVWTGDDWSKFLPELHRIMNPGGVALVQFNLDPFGRVFPAELPGVVTSHGGFQSKFYREYMGLQRID